MGVSGVWALRLIPHYLGPWTLRVGYMGLFRNGFGYLCELCCSMTSCVCHGAASKFGAQGLKSPRRAGATGYSFCFDLGVITNHKTRT